MFLDLPPIKDLEDELVTTRDWEKGFKNRKCMISGAKKLDIMHFILLHFILKLSFCSADRRFTSKTLWMPIVCGLFHCKSQKVKVANSLILLGKIKERTRKLDIDGSKYWFDIEVNDKFADRFRIKRG